jgi:hypothetical protein
VDTFEAGKTILVRVRPVLNPRQSLMREGSVTAQFWRPGTARDDAAGLRPDYESAAWFDEGSRGWIAEADTRGWEPGEWLMRGYAETPGVQRGWAWSRLVLTPGPPVPASP